MAGKVVEFQGSDRFEIIRRLGAGGMGTVYEAIDREARARVALKVLSRLSPAALYLFKQEFRSLAGLTHPNLVTLYELHRAQTSEGDEQWFFTMEFVQGIDFLSYVRRSTGAPTKAADTADTLTFAGPTSGRVRPLIPAAPADPDILRPAFAQLVEALSALHAGRKLHRDIKPSNILVTPEGRVVVLDFGLVAELGERGVPFTPERNMIAGTFAYMSPEQARGEPLTPASDWFSAGVMLYQAITGELPFGGARRDLLAMRVESDAPAVDRLSSRDPLSALCKTMLEQNPKRRASEANIRAALQSAPVSSPPELPFLGRQAELAILERAFARSVEERLPVVVHVEGPPGIGKSALISEFISRSCSRSDTIVLRGRCHEQESIPYKTLDSLMDALARYFLELPDRESLTLAPRHGAALGRVFPVLRRAAAIDTAPARALGSLDIHQVRRLAFGALRELLGRISDRASLVLAIDDLQWADPDGAHQLMELLKPPDAPALLLILSYRDAEPVNEGLVRILNTRDEPGKAVLRISLEPLGREESLAKITEALGGKSSLAESVISEARGNPYLLQELAQQAVGQSRVSSAATLESMLARRIAALPEQARKLLEIVAVAIQPIAYADVCRAGGAPSSDPQLLALLRAGRFIRGGAGPVVEVEPYHDRLREVIVSTMEPSDLRTHHLRLAETFEECPNANPEAIGVHYDLARAPERARPYLVLAAEKAAEALAFRHAAGLLERALDNSGRDVAERLPLKKGLADMLAKAGFNARAAGLYEELCTTAAGHELFELRRKAAYCYAVSGHINEGKAVYRTILGSVGLSLPETPGAALRDVMVARLRLWLRGIRFKRRRVSEIPAGSLVRVDVAWSAATALTMVDLIASASFTTRHLLLALDSGDPERVARGLAWEAVVRGATTRERPQADRMIEASWQAAGELQEGYTKAILVMASGFNASAHGDWRTGVQRFEEAAEVFNRHCPDAAWEINTLRNFRLFGLYSLGAWREMETEARVAMEDAQQRGDLYSLALIGGAIQPLVHIIRDEPEEALAVAKRSLSLWTASGLHMQHIQSARVTIPAKLYAGDAEGAWADIQHLWPRLKKNFALRAESDRIGFMEIRARCALGVLVHDPGRSECLRQLKRSLGSLRKERSDYGQAMSGICEAGFALLRGDRGGAAVLFGKAVAALDRMGAAAGSMLVRRCQTMLTPETPHETVRELDAQLLAHGVRNPTKFAESLAPGIGRQIQSGAER